MLLLTQYALSAVESVYIVQITSIATIPQHTHVTLTAGQNWPFGHTLHSAIVAPETHPYVPLGHAQLRNDEAPMAMVVAGNGHGTGAVELTGQKYPMGH
jgi:hypothetical protein